MVAVSEHSDGDEDGDDTKSEGDGSIGDSDGRIDDDDGGIREGDGTAEEPLSDDDVPSLDWRRSEHGERRSPLALRSASVAWVW